MLVGNSLGGLVALRLALVQPARVAALVLVDSGGLGRAISPLLIAATLPGVGDAGIAWARTPLGAAQRAGLRAAFLFARPHLAPLAWLRDQYELAQRPGFLEAWLASLRAGTDLRGQREVWLDQLPRLRMPTLVVWGDRDAVVPRSQAEAAAARLRRGRLVLIPDCGHLPHVERPAEFTAAVTSFLAELARSPSPLNIADAAHPRAGSSSPVART